MYRDTCNALHRLHFLGHVICNFIGLNRTNSSSSPLTVPELFQISRLFVKSSVWSNWTSKWTEFNVQLIGWIGFDPTEFFTKKHKKFGYGTHTQYSETLEFNAYSEFDSKSSAKRNRILNFFKIFMIRFGRIELTIYPNKDSKFVWQKFSLAFGLVLFASVRFYFELVPIKFESFTVRNYSNRFLS